MEKGIEIGLTGGIGSGKSTVAKMLVELGAKLVDADIIVRELQQPGEPVFQEIVDYFGNPDLLGEDILLEDGTLNRSAIAEVVFNDSEQLIALNNMVHPPLESRMVKLREEYFEKGEKVIVDFPLLVESGYKKGVSKKENTKKSGFQGFDGVAVVDCELEVAIERLVSERGFKKEDVLARMNKQASRKQRIEVADFVIDNSTGLEELQKQVKDCWDWMNSL